MVKVKTKFLSRAREIAGSSGEVVELEDGSRLRDLVEYCIKKYGEAFREYFYGRGKGSPGSSPLVLIDGKQVEGVDTPLYDGCSVTFMAPVAGGVLDGGLRQGILDLSNGPGTAF